MNSQSRNAPSGQCPRSFPGDEAIERARILCTEVVGFDKPWALAIMRGLLGRIAELERDKRSETAARTNHEGLIERLNDHIWAYSKFGHEGLRSTLSEAIRALKSVAPPAGISRGGEADTANAAIVGQVGSQGPATRTEIRVFTPIEPNEL